MPVVSSIIGLVIAAGAAGYGIHEQRQARRESKEAERDQATAQRGLEADKTAQEELDRQAQAKKVMDARKRLTLVQGGKSDKAGTVRTSALGTTADQGNYARKAATGL